MSLEHDHIAETAIERRSSLALLGRFDLFRSFDPAALAAVAHEIEWFSLPGGANLFEEGAAPDGLYLVVSGVLGAYTTGADEQPRQVGRIGAGEVVGEMALISGHARTATVVALRDTELGRFSQEAFERLLLDHPRAMLWVAQLTVQRLEETLQPRRRARSVPRTFAIVPHSIAVSASQFAAQLRDALKAHGRTELVWSARGAAHTSHWFHNVESANDFVIYVADAGDTPWNRLCRRQADVWLLLTRSDARPPFPFALSPADKQTELVLLHEHGLIHTQGWLTHYPRLAHHNVRHAGDVARVARMLTGRGVGLVLSGGGARGFAHIGVVRALREARVPIDAVGGNSLGAILGAGVAGEWPHEELVERFRRTFVDTNPLDDYTLPLVSLVSGRKVSRLLRGEFAETLIEDLPLPFFCVSSNLTTGTLAVHRRGLLWRWLRASVAIPGVLPPVFHNGEVHVDGGAMNNLPVDVMRDFGRGPVIGSDVGADRAFTAEFDQIDVPGPLKVLSWFRSHKKRVNILQILWRAGMVNSAAVTAARREETDLLLQPPLESIDMLNWQAFEAAIDAGYRHTLERLEKLPSGVLRGVR